MGWKSFNDRLAIWLLILIPGIWIADALNVWAMDLNPEVGGALIATWTLVIQYYWRKQPPS